MGVRGTWAGVGGTGRGVGGTRAGGRRGGGGGRARGGRPGGTGRTSAPAGAAAVRRTAAPRVPSVADTALCTAISGHYDVVATARTPQDATGTGGPKGVKGSGRRLGTDRAGGRLRACGRVLHLPV